MKKIFIVVAIASVLGIGIWAVKAGQVSSADTVKLKSFAQYLKQKGVVFYGAFWCPHCKEQKKLFGDAVGELPYVECSTPDGNGQTQICKDKKIEGYPTWVFADGSRADGVQSLEDLAKKTGYPLERLSNK